MAKHSYTKEQSIAFNNAIYRKNTKDVKDFLDKYPSLIFTRWGLDEKASLHYAAQVGCGGIINDLLVAGAEVNVTTYWNDASLHYAAEGGHTEAANNLLDAGADVNAKGHMQQTPLHMAVEAGHREAANALLVAGAKVNAKDNAGQTPLHLAAKKGHREIVKDLLVAEADVNAINRYKQTPASYATERGDLEMALALKPGLYIKSAAKGSHVQQQAERKEKATVSQDSGLGL